MKKRQENLLNYTIKYYIKTAQPIGSQLLSKRTNLNVSSATIRNELLELEENGYLFQPHTSAGRIPTEKGYRFWINNFYKDKKISLSEKASYSFLKNFKKASLKKDKMKSLSKVLANNAKLAVIFAFSPNDVYYTGISYLFSQPEFRKYELIYSVSRVVDQIDNVLDEIFLNAKEELNIFIGSENPISKECSLLSLKLGRQKLLSLLGPMRMDYEKNIASLRYILNLMNK